MAIAAGQIVSGEPFGGIGDVRPDMGVGRGDQIAPAPHLQPMGIIGQGAGVRDAPDFGIWSGEVIGGGGGLRPCAERH